MFKRISVGRLYWPTMEKHGIEVPDDAKDLISGLLQKDPSKRLGRGGGQEVLSHPFFLGLDIDQMTRRELEAPFVPG